MQFIKLVPGALALSCAINANVADAKKTVGIYKVPLSSDFPSILRQLPSDMNTGWLNVNYDRQDWRHKYSDCDGNGEVIYSGDGSSRECCLSQRGALKTAQTRLRLL